MARFRGVKRDERLPIYRRPACGKNTVPAHLDNQTGWKRRGYHVKPGAAPVAQALVGLNNVPACLCNLYDQVDCVLIGKRRRRPQQRSRIASPS